MMNQTAPQVNPIQVNETRASFIQFIPALALLQSRNPPPVRSPFLLSDVDFQKQYSKVQSAQTGQRAPGPERYGKLFWSRYVTNSEPHALWRGLVPIEYSLQAIVESLVLNNCNVVLRAYLYPWGIGVVADVKLMDAKPLDQTVNLLRDIRDRARIKWKFDTLSGMASPEVLTSKLRERLHPDIYGDKVDQEDPGTQFTIVTVVDADGVVATDPIADGGPIHLALEGFIGWDRNWAVTPPLPNALVKFRIPSLRGPVGHIVYGNDRARAVWLPKEFRSTADFPDRLSCYHQNLSVAALHTEALCVLAQDAATELRRQGSLENFSAAYRTCAQLAAGRLGPLRGNKKEDSKDTNRLAIYRSGSILAHIFTCKEAIDLLRQSFPTIGTPLDA